MKSMTNSMESMMAPSTIRVHLYIPESMADMELKVLLFVKVPGVDSCVGFSIPALPSESIVTFLSSPGTSAKHVAIKIGIPTLGTPMKVTSMPAHRAITAYDDGTV